MFGNFNIGPFKDEVLSMSAYHFLLGRPWSFDGGAIYGCRKNLVTIENDGQKFTLEKEMGVRNLSLVKSCVEK